MPRIREGFCGSIGKTSLIRLTSLCAATQCEILGKAEFLNPAGSVKDRAALGIIADAEERGHLKPGGTVVEGTAGNTGIGLTAVAHAKGYSTVIVIPNNQAPEKIELLRALGADVRTVPPAPYREAGNYNKVAARLADEICGGFWANQFDNLANRRFHYSTTGPEIWNQTGGAVSAFICAVGTGGTLAGVTQYLKEQNNEIIAACADPYGAAMWSWFKYGHTDYDDGDSIAEGIGQGRVTKNIEGIDIDDAYRIPDPLMIEIIYYLLGHEGLFLGTSSGINVCGALKVALEGGPGQTIVTVLADGAQRYQSRLFNREWLEGEKLAPKGLELAAILEQLESSP